MMEFFIEKIVSREVYSQKNSMVDALLGSKHASAFWTRFKRLISS